MGGVLNISPWTRMTSIAFRRETTSSFKRRRGLSVFPGSTESFDSKVSRTGACVLVIPRLLFACQPDPCFLFVQEGSHFAEFLAEHLYYACESVGKAFGG